MSPKSLGWAEGSEGLWGVWGQRSYHPIGPALKQYIFMPPFVRHRVAHAHVLDVHVTLDVRTRFEEYRVAIKCRDESRHVTYGKT